MSFGKEFMQSPMNSFVYTSDNQSNFTTPMKNNNNNNNNNNLRHVTLTTINTNNMQNENISDNMNNMSNNNEKKATKYDYLDYGNYINRLLSSSLITNSSHDEINWNMPRVSDKVNIINAILSIISNKNLYQNLLQQSRDTIEQLKIDLHSYEMKINKLKQENKILNNDIANVFKRKEFLEKEIKNNSQNNKILINKLKKENENLKYRDKKYCIDIRKKDQIFRNQQEKIKKLLDERDKKSFKCLGMKLLNSNNNNIVFKQKNNEMTNVYNKTIKYSEYMKYIQKNNILNDNNHLLQSQIANLQNQLKEILNENLILRESLLKLEVNCKESLLKVNDLFSIHGNDNDGEINKFKYAMPVGIANDLINRDISECSNHLCNVLDELKININQRNNIQNTKHFKLEIIQLQTRINELEETNKEYESLIRTYVNSE